LLGASWAAAQNYPSQTGGTGSETTLQGCLAGTDAGYTLTDKNGTTFQLTGDTAMLSEHVGHEVKVTGVASSASPSASGAASGTMAKGSSSSQEAIHVSSIKHISKTCKSGAMSH